jgi:Clp amino terminal domain, pathogenicity island component
MAVGGGGEDLGTGGLPPPKAEADRFSHNYIGTEHLLFGLL